jgi:deoxycytidylate deaminase
MLARHLTQIARATEQAMSARHPKWHLGAVIARGNRVVSVGSNKRRNRPMVNHEESSEHAEAAALRAARGKDLRGATIYVARVMKNGDTGMARPCRRCMQALVEAGIKTVIYTNDVDSISEERVW